MRKAIIAWLVILLSSLPVQAPAEETRLPERFDIHKPSTHWEPLPHGVQWALAAPDGRIWFQCGPKYYEDAPALSEIQRRIEDEFSRPMPQIFGATILLFEPGGRVWFYVRPHATFLGYDGSQWICHPVDERQQQPGCRCATRGGLFDNRTHRFAGGTAWFLARSGIHRFDGEKWFFQEMIKDKAGAGSWPILAVSADGQLAVAYVHASQTIWVFREGAWEEEEVFSRPDQWIIDDLAIDNSRTIWYVLRWGRLRRWNLDAEGRIVRSEAARESAERPSVRDDTAVPFGSARVTNVKAMFHDESGRIYIAADAVDNDCTSGKPTKPGVVLREPTGRVRLLPGGEHAPLWVPCPNYPPPIIAEAGNQIWLPGGTQDATPALLDTAPGEIVDRLPRYGYVCLHAAAAGSTYVSHNSSYEHGKVIMVYTPGAPKPEQLESLSKEIGERRVVVGGDGAVWTVDSLRRLVRFHEGDWTVMEPEPENWLKTMLPGNGSVMLIERRNEWSLYHEGSEADRDSLLELVEKHRDLIGEAFAPGSPSPDSGKTFLVAGPKGLVWYLEAGALRLLEGRRWHDALGPLMGAGSRSGHVQWMAPIGDGRRVYASDFALIHDGGKSFVVGLKDGKLRTEVAPHVREMSFDNGGKYLGIRDTKGALWLPTSKTVSAGTCDHTTAQLAVRLDETGIAGKWENRGWARLVDASGNVWFDSVPGKGGSVLNVWRDGEFIQEISVPGYEGSLLFSGGPGSVHVHTAAGIGHLLAEPPGFRRYRLDKVYGLPETLWGTVPHAFSKQGYVLFLLRPRGQSQPSVLHLVKLPYDEEGAH